MKLSARRFFTATQQTPNVVDAQRERHFYSHERSVAAAGVNVNLWPTFLQSSNRMTYFWQLLQPLHIFPPDSACMWECVWCTNAVVHAICLCVCIYVCVCVFVFERARASNLPHPQTSISYICGFIKKTFTYEICIASECTDPLLAPKSAAWTAVLCDCSYAYSLMNVHYDVIKQG